MARGQSPQQKTTVERVMHEFKHGELKTARGSRKVKNPKQAIAIALSEAGASKFEAKQKNAHNLRHTKRKERRGETYEDAAEGRHATQETYRRATARSGGRTANGHDKTRKELYAEAKRRGISGRSKMSKSDLAHALHA